MFIEKILMLKLVKESVVLLSPQRKDRQLGGFLFDSSKDIFSIAGLDTMKLVWSAKQCGIKSSEYERAFRFGCF